MASLEDSLEKELECPICREELNQPKIAGPCGHTFCQDCLQRHIATTAILRNRFNCPFCRRICTTPQDGVQELATNFTVARIIESLNESRRLKEEVVSNPCELCQGGAILNSGQHSALTTDVCEGRWIRQGIRRQSRAAAAAEQACAECDGMKLCKPCGRQHQKHHATKHHEVTGICKPHGKPLRFFCRTCDVLFCVLCRAAKLVQENHLNHVVVSYFDEVSTGRRELRTALRTARKETKGELEEVEGRLVYLLAEETRTLNSSRDDIQKSVEDAVSKNESKMKTRDARIELLLQEVARLRQDNNSTSEQNTRFRNLRDNLAHNLEETRERAVDDVTESRGEIVSLMYPLNKQIKHGQRLMAEKTLMPELRGNVTDTTQQLNELSSSAKTDRLTNVKERIALRKPGFHEVVELLDDFSNSVDIDSVDEDSSGQSVRSGAEIGLEYYASRGKNASGCSYQDMKIPTGVKRVHGISIMSGNRSAGCGPVVGQSQGTAYRLWMWDATELKTLMTDDVPMIDLATVGDDELVILRSENPFLRLFNVVTQEVVHDIRIKKYDRDGLLSLWQVEVVTPEKFVMSYRTKDRVHHIAIVNKEGSIVQDIEVEQRQCIAFCRIKSLIIACPFSGTTLTVYRYDSEQGTNKVESLPFSQLYRLPGVFQCTDICSGSLGEVYVVGRIEQQLFQPSWKKSDKEIHVYHLCLDGFGEDARLVLFGRDISVQRMPTPGLEMRSAWVPKCSMGGRPANSLLVEYGNEVKIITLRASNQQKHEVTEEELCRSPIRISMVSSDED